MKTILNGACEYLVMPKKDETSCGLLWSGMPYGKYQIVRYVEVSVIKG